MNKTELLEKIRHSKKIDYEKCVTEEFKRKTYFHELKLDDVRRRFRIASSMEHVRGNFSSKYKSDSLACQSCLKRNRATDEQTDSNTITPRESQNHILNQCPAYDDLHLQFDTETDLGIVQFFKSVTERRIEEGEV